MLVKAGSTFTPAPEGIHNAVCVDVIDLGLMETKYGKKPKLRIVFELEAKNDKGDRLTCGQMYGATLGEKATLRKELRSWRGKEFTQEELMNFEMDNIVGKPCQIVVEHAAKGDAVYANVAKIMKAALKLEPSGKYIRVKDRPADQQQKPQNGNGNAPTDDGEEIPF